jgi:hypothetical protein
MGGGDGTGDRTGARGELARESRGGAEHALGLRSSKVKVTGRSLAKLGVYRRREETRRQENRIEDGVIRYRLFHSTIKFEWGIINSTPHFIRLPWL